jgi:hypothetical protein
MTNTHDAKLSQVHTHNPALVRFLIASTALPSPNNRQLIPPRRKSRRPVF